MGLAKFFVLYYSNTHYPEGSLAGMMQSGFGKLTGDDSIAVLRKQGAERWTAMLTEVQNVLQGAEFFEYVPSAEDNPNVALAEQPKNLAAYAQKHDLDLVFSASDFTSGSGSRLLLPTLDLGRGTWDNSSRNRQSS